MPLFEQRVEEPRAEPTRMAQVAEPAAFAPRAAEPMAPAQPAAAAVDYVLPVDSLNAVADGAGLQWVNSDAEKIRAAQAAMAASRRRSTCRARSARSSSPDEGPLVLVETTQGPVAGSPAVREPGAQRLSDRGRSARSGPAAAQAAPGRFVSGQAFERALVGRRVHQLVPGDRHRLRQQVEAARFALRIGLPVAVGLGLAAARRAARRPRRRRRATGCTAAPCRSRRRARAPPPRRS